LTALHGQGFDGDLREWDQGASFGGFRLGEHWTAVSDAEGVADVNQAGVQVDIFPAQGGGFAEAHAGGEHRRPEPLMAVPFDHSQERSDFFG
jgi:hypothetical protein